MKNIFRTVSFLLVGAALCSAAVSCQQKIDNEYSRHNFSIEMRASSEAIVLDESKPNETALTISWTPAAEYGDDYTTTYLYTVEHTTSTASGVKEYEDEGNFTRSYTNKELQDMLIGRFGQLTSTRSGLKFTITASFEGPKLIIPDEASVMVSVKTYGAKQFAADKVWLGGSVVAENVELTANANNPALYVWQGNLKAGDLNFPVVFGDENNLIVPATDGQTVTGTDAMDAKIVDATVGGGWKITNPDAYRVTLNFTTKTVAVVPVSSIIEIDKIYLAGTAAPTEETEVTKCLEKDGLYAFRGELKAGTLWFPIEFEQARTVAIVSKSEFADGTAVPFSQTAASGAAAKAWNIPADGTYRIVIDTEAKTVTIYSAATDEVVWTATEWKNTTVSPVLVEKTVISNLWMWGDFASDAYGNKGSDKYMLTPSLANPRVFIYYKNGEALPRGGNATVKFMVSGILNNVYAYGASTTRDKHVKTELGVKVTEVYGGQGNNRYSRWIIPEGTNYIEVFIGSKENEVVNGSIVTASDAYVLFDKR